MSELKSSVGDPPRRRGAVAVITRGEQFLVIRRSALVAAPRKFCFPGGGIEGAETEAEALIRELDEELGVEIVPIACVWRSVTRWNVELHWWQADLKPSAVIAPNPAEVESVHWLTSVEMLAEVELLESNREFLREIAGGQIVLRSLPGNAD